MRKSLNQPNVTHDTFADDQLPTWLLYSPEKFAEETHGLKPVRHWQDFSLARLEVPDNFEAD